MSQRTPTDPGAASSALWKRLEAYRASHPPRVQRTGAGGFTYTVGGSGPRTLLVLHGGGSVGEAAHPFTLALEPHARVITIDWPATVTTVEQVMEGVLAVADAEGATRFAVLGFSMGGMLAQRLASAHPGRVEKLLLVVSMGPSERYARRFRRSRKVLGWIPDRWLRAASKKAVAKWVAQNAQERPEDVAFVAAHRAWMFDAGKVTKATLLSDADVLVDFFSHPFAAFSGPVLIVEGEADRMVDAEERAALRRTYPDARVVTLPASDHFATVLAPASVTTPLREFLVSEGVER